MRAQFVTGGPTMTTSHDRPTPPSPRSPDEQEQEQRSAAGPRDGGHSYGTIAGSGWLGLTPWQALTSAGAVAFILGLIVLVWPGATLLVVALLFGCYLVLSGVMSLIEGLADRHADGAMRIAYIVLGVLGVMLGLFCLRRIDVTVVLLAFLLSAFWIMRGVLDLAVASSRHEVAGRGLRVFTGVLSLIAGILVLFWPGITLTVLLTFAGCWLLIYGIMLAILGLGLRRAVQRAA